MFWSSNKPDGAEGPDTRTPAQKATDERHGLSGKGLEEQQHEMMVRHGLLMIEASEGATRDGFEHGLADEQTRAQAQREREAYDERLHGIPRHGGSGSAGRRRTRQPNGMVGGRVDRAVAVGIGLAIANANSVLSVPTSDDSDKEGANR